MRKLPSLLLALPLLAACGKQPVPPEPLRPVKTLRVELQPGSSELTLPGEVHARHEAPLAFRVGGKISACYAELGEKVRRGQVLARLEPEDYQLAAQRDAANEAQARSQMILAEADLKRYRTLRDKGFVSATALDQKQAAYDAARAALKAMQANRSEQDRKLGYTALTADGDGVVTSLNCNIGQVVSPGQQVLGLARSGAKEIAVFVPESSLAAFRHSKSFNISLNAHPEKIYHGMLRELSGGADPATRTYAARITVTDADDAMQLGMSATVRMQSGGEMEIHLPLTAVISRDGTPGVWKLGSNGIVHRTAVSVSGVEGDELRISGGLAPGDLVVTAGANLLREGEKVKLWNH
jgi:membrane fusion protein, multidrug efflux system